MKRWRVAPLLLLTCLILFAACSQEDHKKKAEAPPVPVTTAKAEERDIPVTLKVVGRTEAYESVVLKSRVDGQVANVLFAEGQRVRKGDLLIQLDPADFSARLQQAAATSARDAALLDKMRADTARYTALKERNFVSEEKVNEVRTNEAAATANLRASKAAAEVLRLQTSYTAIRAPFDGIVGARVVFPGSSVKTNETALAVVNRVRPLLVSFSVAEKHLPLLRAAIESGQSSGQSSGQGMKADITLPSDEKAHFAGTVHFLDNAVDATTGTILMKARLSNDDEKLTPGQFVNVALLLDTLPHAVVVPKEAVQQGAEGNFIYVVKDDNSVEVRKVEIAAADSGMAAIGKGLQVNETVVTDGQLRLTPGSKIKTKTPERTTEQKPPQTPTTK